MTTIGPSSLLFAEIRAQALAWKRKASSGSGKADKDQAPRADRGAPRDWSAQVARAVVAISPDDPQRHRKAFRAYLVAVLARDCRIPNLEDPGFQRLVDQVQDAMEIDPGMRKATREAGRMLLEGAGT